MSPAKPSAFAVYIATQCVEKHTYLRKMGAKIGIEPLKLLSMINGKTPITKTALAGLAKELGCDVAYLTKLPRRVGRIRGAS
jgi:hypothetical protein